MRVDRMQQRWLLVRREYTVALAEYEAAYRALAARPPNETIEGSSSPEFVAEHRAREKLLAVRRRMEQLDPARTKVLPFHGTALKPR